MKLKELFETTGGVVGGTTSSANFSPSSPNSGVFVGSLKYKKKLKKESGGNIAHKAPSTVGTTSSLTYGKQKLKTFNTSQPDSAAKFLNAMS